MRVCNLVVPHIYTRMPIFLEITFEKCVLHAIKHFYVSGLEMWCWGSHLGGSRFSSLGTWAIGEWQTERERAASVRPALRMENILTPRDKCFWLWMTLQLECVKNKKQTICTEKMLTRPHVLWCKCKQTCHLLSWEAQMCDGGRMKWSIMILVIFYSTQESPWYF